MHGAGHRTVPHTADLRVEAWGPTREACLEQAVLGTVAAFATVESPVESPAVGTAPPPLQEHRATLEADSDEDLLVAVLDELVYVVDTTGRVPVDLTVERAADGVELVLDLVGPDRVEQVGAPPKAVSLHELRFEQRADGWWCSVTLDV